MKYFVEQGSGYEFGIDGEKIFITKSPRSAASREKPKSVKVNTKAYNAIKKFIDNEIKKDSNQDTTPLEASVKEKEFKLEKENLAHELPQGVVLKDFSDFKESTWLSGEHDTIDAVQINGKNYFSLGYVQDTDTGKEGIAVKMTYEESRELNASSGKNIPAILAPIKTIKPASGIYDVPFKRGKDQENFYLVPWGTAGVKIYVTVLNTLDDATIADKIQIVGDVIGAIPVVGFVGDFAGMTIELLKPDRNFFMAGVYALGAVPLLGEAIVVLKATKSLPKIASKATANEAALKLASKVSGDVDSFQKIGQTIRGSSLTRRLVEFADEFEAFFRRNIPQLEAIGVRLSEEVVDKFFLYFSKFVAAYKVYLSLKPVELMGKFLNLVVIAQRPTMYVGSETIGKDLQKYIESIDLYKIAGVQPTDNPFDDAVKIAKNLDTKLTEDAITEEIAVANIKFNQYLESSSFSKFLDTQPSETKITEITMINEENLRKLIRSLL